MFSGLSSASIFPIWPLKTAVSIQKFISKLEVVSLSLLTVSLLLKDSTNCSVWSKTTLISGGVSGAEVNHPFCETGTFFHRSLAVSVPI